MKTLSQIVRERQDIFRKEYRDAYKDILSPEVLGEGNPWFESHSRQTAVALVGGMIKVVEAEISDWKDLLARRDDFGHETVNGQVCNGALTALKDIHHSLKAQREEIKKL